MKHQITGFVREKICRGTYHLRHVDYRPLILRSPDGGEPQVVHRICYSFFPNGGLPVLATYKPKRHD